MNTTIENMVNEIGLLIAGSQRVNGDITLRKLKPNKYAPQTEFGQWLENTVNSAIKKSKLEIHMDLMEKLCRYPDLVPIAQYDMEIAFIESFGAEKIKSNPSIDKILSNSKITKLSFLAKENGINKDEVDLLVQKVVSKVLREHNAI